MSTSRRAGLVAAAVLFIAGGTARAGFVVVSVQPAGSGTTTGAGYYSDGSSCTVTATPYTGYDFVAWVDAVNYSILSTERAYTFTVNGNHSLVAFFRDRNQRIVVTVPNPEDGGTTTGGGVYSNGATCTVTATANAGYGFLCWAEGTTIVSTSASYTFTVSADRVLVANFGVLRTIATSSTPAAGGTTSGAGQYPTGAVCTVTATAATGYDFIAWTEDGTPVSASAQYAFVVEADRTLVANFQIKQYAIVTSASPPAGGTTSGSGVYDHGTDVTVTATPSAGYGFVRWTEAGRQVSTSASYVFQATANRSLVAEFVRVYTITASAGSHGSISPQGAVTVAEGASQTFAFSPDSGYAVEEVQVDGSAAPLCLSYTFSAVGADHTIDVTFGADSDSDQLADSLEATYGTTVGDSDSDDDGYTDGAEVMAGTDPLDRASHPSEGSGGGGCAAPPGGRSLAGASILAAMLLAAGLARRAARGGA